MAQTSPNRKQTNIITTSTLSPITSNLPTTPISTPHDKPRKVPPNLATAPPSSLTPSNKPRKLRKQRPR